MENKRENKKFYKKLIIVLLSVWLFMLIIPLNTILYDKETYVYEPQNYGYKNLAVSDLESKEYLGDGVYNLYNDNGITIDYNVYNGQYKINGTTTNNINVVLFNVLNDTKYTISYISVSGTVIGLGVNILVAAPTNNIIVGITHNTNQNATFLTTTQTTMRLFSLSDRTFENYIFKLQLEKGDTATDYEIPIEPLIYHYKGGIKNA